ncbi:hypothetical protein [Paraburkholderia tagetis]|uniref:Uncharacterized protein n=1 Tax=Paraburkholderia tagetis TaxID=2913261 RepID=A0A9X1ULP9_9BURK|nr:hypothetical protein [Paraburkholderia tagetis]MCG5077699.1 hypothetical protein [Paraburkholderia tagetis]
MSVVSIEFGGDAAFYFWLLFFALSRFLVFVSPRTGATLADRHENKETRETARYSEIQRNAKTTKNYNKKQPTFQAST